MHVLIVTESDTNIHEINDPLFKTASTVNIVKAFSIDEATRLISAVQFDLVFYDLAFPENCIAENLKQLSVFSGKVPIIALANNVSDPAVKEALNFGADYHMAKDQLQLLSGVESFKALLLKDTINYN